MDHAAPLGPWKSRLAKTTCLALAPAQRGLIVHADLRRAGIEINIKMHCAWRLRVSAQALAKLGRWSRLRQKKHTPQFRWRRVSWRCLPFLPIDEVP
eukprot:1426952-Pyramimonas_sp.AAC.1